MFGWDDEDAGLESQGADAPRPPSVRPSRHGPELNSPHSPSRPLYLLEDEYAAEIANRTVHGVMHLSWVPSPDGGYRGQMAVLVKRNGSLRGRLHGGHRPFRHLIVYPAIIGESSENGPTAPDRDSQRRIVLYDGECGFCMWLLSGLLRWDRRGAAATRFPSREPRPPSSSRDLDPAERMASWHLIATDGSRPSGGEAIPPLLRLLPGGRVPAAAFARFPTATSRGYRWVAEHRTQRSRVPKPPNSVPRRIREVRGSSVLPPDGG